MDEKFMQLALKEAEKSYKKGDVPVGAVLVFNNKVIAKSHNKKETSKIATRHAEILVIEKSCKKLHTWRLEECTLYVTMEPCLMCAGAILQSRIKRLVYAVENSKFGFVGSIDKILNDQNNHTVKVESGMCASESQQLLKEFFKEKRD